MVERKEYKGDNTKDFREVKSRRMDWSTIFVVRSLFLIILIIFILPALVITLGKTLLLTLSLVILLIIVLWVIIGGKMWLRSLSW